MFLDRLLKKPIPSAEAVSHIALPCPPALLGRQGDTHMKIGEKLHARPRRSAPLAL